MRPLQTRPPARPGVFCSRTFVPQCKWWSFCTLWQRARGALCLRSRRVPRVRVSSLSSRMRARDVVHQGILR
eukprot:4348410-Lingulodinium_polyedra.AAC.1